MMYKMHQVSTASHSFGQIEWTCSDHCHCPAPFTFFAGKRGIFTLPPDRGYFDPSHFLVIMCVYLVLLINLKPTAT